MPSTPPPVAYFTFLKEFCVSANIAKTRKTLGNVQQSQLTRAKIGKMAFQVDTMRIL
jgi:hypothetical protein